jgi:hypothetical protein
MDLDTQDVLAIEVLEQQRKAVDMRPTLSAFQAHLAFLAQNRFSMLAEQSTQCPALPMPIFDDRLPLGMIDDFPTLGPNALGRQVFSQF